MSDFAATMAAVVRVFQVEFTIYGFTFSLWEVFLFSIVAGLVLWFIGRVFLDE